MSFGTSYAALAAASAERGADGAFSAEEGRPFDSGGADEFDRRFEDADIAAPEIPVAEKSGAAAEAAPRAPEQQAEAWGPERAAFQEAFGATRQPAWEEVYFGPAQRSDGGMALAQGQKPSSKIAFALGGALAGAALLLGGGLYVASRRSGPKGGAQKAAVEDTFFY